MAYYNGTANDLTALRQALIDACVAEGWAWDATGEVLSQGALFLRLQIVSGYLTLLGRTGAAAGDAPNVVRIGQIGSTPLAYPLAYELFVFAGEVYLVVNYSLDYYQWAAFGDSTVLGLPGSGLWLGASLAAMASVGLEIYAVSGGSSGRSTGALFWATGGYYAQSRNCWVHSDFDAQGWWLAQTLSDNPVGIAPTAPLMGLLPNAWNSEAVLLPIRAYKVRPSYKLSLTADLENARYTRIDNYTPGQIVTLGSERWKVFPWYRKDTTARNGGSGIDHSGTFGWAIRYEGP